MAAEEPDAAHLAVEAEVPEDAILREDLEDIWAAFWALNSERPAVPALTMVEGMATTRICFGSIPFRAVDCYASRMGYSAEAFDEFCELISVLDDEYVKIDAEQRSATGG